MKKIFATIIFLPLLVIAAEWQSLNGPPAGRADDMCMGWDPLHYYWVIYAADQTHKLYKSTDEGEYWDSIATHPYVTNPTCVITEPNNAQIVYVGEIPEAPNTHCVWKSEDGGQTWNYKDYGITNTQPLCFAMDPFNSSIVYLGCKSDGNKPVLFRTTDGGFCWERLNISNYDINDILVLFFVDEGIVLILATDKGILRGRPYDESPHPFPPPQVGRDKGRGGGVFQAHLSFKLVKAGEFKLLKYDKKLKKIFAKGSDKIYQSADGKKWQIYQSNDSIDFSGISDIINWRNK